MCCTVYTGANAGNQGHTQKFVQEEGGGLKCFFSVQAGGSAFFWAWKPLIKDRFHFSRRGRGLSPHSPPPTTVYASAGKSSLQKYVQISKESLLLFTSFIGWDSQYFSDILISERFFLWIEKIIHFKTNSKSGTC